ncbi:MAG TPA: hypothetical protein DCS19_08120, partial [Flavobacterium sp.]|nr:hypothetical protein [Flavobacterium sp.]
MKVIKNNNRIFLPDWQKFKPKTINSKTDIYYLSICNKVFTTLKNTNNQIIFQKLSLSEIKELCCFLTAYFEDIISQTNIWKAFTTKHYELYNSFVPLEYSEEYFEDEINSVDIHFLIWYFVSIKNENSLIGFFNSYIIDIVEDIYDVFDDNYDDAPENQVLKNYYFLDPNENDYYKVRYFIEKVFFNNYLLKIDVFERFQDQIESVSEHQYNESFEVVLYELKDQFLLDTKSKLLALGSNEWAAYIVGKNNKLHKDLLHISKKIRGKFLFKNKIDSKYVYLEHIASGKKFNLLKSSYDHHTILKKDAILTIGIVKWQNEWWFSGTSIISPFDANLILDEKNSIESRHEVSFLENENEIKKHLKLQYERFLAYNNNLPLTFLEKKEINDFIHHFFDYYKNKLKLSKKEIEESNKRMKNEGLRINDAPNSIEFEEDFETGIVYFNPNSGIEIYFDICSVLDLKSNPYFEEEDFRNDNLDLLINDFYS